MPVRADPSRPDRRVLTAADGTPVGRFLPGERDGRPLADLFELDTRPAIAVAAIRAPGHPGTGRALLARALRLAAAAGLPALGLAVTDGNPAIRVYEALGFRRILTSMSVDV